MTMKTYQILSRAIGAQARCLKDNNTEWTERWQGRINALLEDFPSGSGYDRGTGLNVASTPEKLIFDTAFHHMDENGYYCGWSEHQVIVTPSLEMGYRLRITGRDYNQIKDMMAEDFSFALDKEQPEHKPAVEATA